MKTSTIMEVVVVVVMYVRHVASSAHMWTAVQTPVQAVCPGAGDGRHVLLLSVWLAGLEMRLLLLLLLLLLPCTAAHSCRTRVNTYSYM